MRPDPHNPEVPLGFSFKVRIYAQTPHEDGMKGVKKEDESLRRRRGRMRSIQAT